MPTIEYNNKNYTSTKQNFGARVDECPTHKVEDSIMSDVSGNFRPDDYEVAAGSHNISMGLKIGYNLTPDINQRLYFAADTTWHMF